MTRRVLVSLVGAHLTASALHFADNAVRFGHYHDEATAWLNPTVVVVAWFVQAALGAAGLVLHRRGNRAGRPLLLAFAVLGFAGFLHYLAPPSHAMDAWTHGLIALEAATGLALLVAFLVPRTGRASRTR